MTYIIGVGSIPYHKYPSRTFSDLTLETLIDLQKDLKDETMILSRDTEEIFFGNCAMDRFGQSNIRDQVVLQDAIDARSDANVSRLTYDDNTTTNNNDEIIQGEEEVSKGLPTGPVLMSDALDKWLKNDNNSSKLEFLDI